MEYQSMKRITTAGKYVLGRRHIIELETGQECVYPNSYGKETFADRAAIRRRYPELAIRHFDQDRFDIPTQGPRGR